jgi:ABC-type glycerol-3-phosphate transport system permease component
MIWTRQSIRYLFYGIAIVTSAIMIGPLYWMLATSFKVPSGVFAVPPQWIPSPWTLANRDVHALPLRQVLPQQRRCHRRDRGA